MDGQRILTGQNGRLARADEGVQCSDVRWRSWSRVGNGENEGVVTRHRLRLGGTNGATRSDRVGSATLCASH